MCDGLHTSRISKSQRATLLGVIDVPNPLESQVLLLSQFRNLDVLDLSQTSKFCAVPKGREQTIGSKPIAVSAPAEDQQVGRGVPLNLTIAWRNHEKHVKDCERYYTTLYYCILYNIIRQFCVAINRLLKVLVHG